MACDAAKHSEYNSASVVKVAINDWVLLLALTQCLDPECLTDEKLVFS